MRLASENKRRNDPWEIDLVKLNVATVHEKFD